jgi:hypothetical protein
VSRQFINLFPMKTQRKINRITNARWTAYAAAATAAGFVGTNSAEATIHYSGLVNQKIGGRDSAAFPLDPAGGSFVVNHFNFVAGSSSFNVGGIASFNIYGAESASVNGGSCTCMGDPQPCASKLNRGDAISVRPFVSDGGILAYEAYFAFGSSVSCGNFLDRGIGLVGFKFNNGAGVQYGWVRLKFQPGDKHMVEVVDYAYGDPGDTVVAGQKSGDSAPRLESLGGLAMGAAGLLAWRRRKSSY